MEQYMRNADTNKMSDIFTTDKDRERKADSTGEPEVLGKADTIHADVKIAIVNSFNDYSSRNAGSDGKATNKKLLQVTSIRFWEFLSSPVLPRTTTLVISEKTLDIMTKLFGLFKESSQAINIIDIHSVKATVVPPLLELYTTLTIYHSRLAPHIKIAIPFLKHSDALKAKEMLEGLMANVNPPASSPAIPFRAAIM